jgi:hypothetical protein
MPYKADDRYETPGGAEEMWRFMDLLKFTHLLETSSLWFSRLDLLDDPREGRFTNFELQHVRASGELGEVFFRAAELSRRHSFVNCWFGSKEESIAMWKLFGSVAIRTSAAKIITALTSASQTIYMGRVKYLKWQSDIMSPDIHSRVMVVRKSSPYTHESEVRLLITDQSALSNPVTSAKIASAQETALHDSKQLSEFQMSKVIHDILMCAEVPTGLRVQVDLNELLAEVIVGPDLPEWAASHFSKLLQRYDVTCPVRLSEMHDANNTGYREIGPSRQI